MKTINVMMIVLLTIGSLTGCRKENGVFDILPKHFLSAEKYTKLTIEVISIEGHEPNNEAINNLKSFLKDRLNKPDGIDFKYTTITSPNNHTFSVSDLQEIEKSNRTQFAKNGTLTAYVFYADQGSSEDTDSRQVLGLAYGSTSICIFKQTVNDNSGGIGQVSEATLETAVLMHEFGHILGLVNNGTPMTQNHEDPNRAHHCDNQNCLMYFESSTTDMLGIIGNGEIPTLDSQCIKDLQANGGK
ncbi:MAG: peptidase [Flavobacteriales bacterium]|nr:peptidase [Flavobacteriales bacterium]